MSMNNAIYYNGVWLDIVKLMQHRQEPQYSGQNYVHTKHTLVVRAMVSNDAERKYVRNKSISQYEMRDPYSAIQNLRIPDKSDLNNPLVIGDASNQNYIREYNQFGEAFDDDVNDLHKPTWDIQAVRHHLLQPRGVLLYYLNDNLVLGCPQFPFAAMNTDQDNALRSMDAKNGPLPQSAVIHSLTNNMLTVDYTIVCYINESMALQQLNKTLFVSAHSYFVDIDVDTYGMETRSVSGIVNFRSDLLKQFNYVPDDFREFFAPPIPFGFKREMFSVKVDADNCKMQYKLVDREVHYVINRYAGKNDVWVGDNTVFGEGVIDRSKIMRMQVAQTKTKHLAGFSEGFAGFVSLPDTVEHLSVRVFGNNFASRFEMERVAFYIAVVRLPYVSLCSRYNHEVRHDLVGQYVELMVTRVTKAGFEALGNMIKDWTMIPNVQQADAKAVALGQMLTGTGRVYFPASTYSQIDGGEDIENITYSAANPTEYDSNKITEWVFEKSNFEELTNQITNNQIGTNSNNQPRYVNDFNIDYARSFPVLMPNNTRSRGSAGTVAHVHTAALLDPADPINNPGSSADMAHIKRVNTDYRFRDINLASSVAVATAAEVNVRSLLNQYGVAEGYLNNPANVNGFYALPAAPESYYYQFDA